MRRPIYKRSHYFEVTGFATGVIAIDVDKTLVVAGMLNERLAEWLRKAKADGKKLMLWSARGEAHAAATASEFGVDDLFDVIIGKPELTVDDDLWRWTRFSKALHPHAFGE